MTTSPTLVDRSGALNAFVRLSLLAGRKIMEVYDGEIDVMTKADASPVTAADTAAEAVILTGLAALAPHVPVIAEEEVAAGRTPVFDNAFFIVDPLDGTKEFIQRRGDFTVNIALVEDGRPTLGVVYAPARGRMFGGDVTEGYAWSSDVCPDAADVDLDARQPIRVRPLPEGGLAAVASKSHNTPETDAYLAEYDVAERVSVGSSLKFCLVAAGEADLYPRLAPTCEWDTGAGHAVLAAAGGQGFGPDGAPLAYGKPRFFNTGFVAAGSLTPKPLAPFMPA